jgi:hypothetical protein
MTVSINDLTSATALSTADQVPISSGSDRDTRKMSLSLLLSWLQSNLVFTAAKPVQQFAAPTTGQTVTVATGDTWLILTPAGTLAALTVNMPTNRTDGQSVRVTSSQTLTALTVSGNGTTIAGAPTTLTANGFFTMTYTATLNTWLRTD